MQLTLYKKFINISIIAAERGKDKMSRMICRILGHKWKFTGRAGMDDYTPGFIVYECQRCGLYCHEKEEVSPLDR